MDQIIKIAWELNENTDNRYKLVYEIAELAKKLVDETQMKKARDEFGFEEAAVNDNPYKKENFRFSQAEVFYCKKILTISQFFVFSRFIKERRS